MKKNESGNVLFIILLAVGLIAALTAAIQGSNNSESANIDDETIAIRVSEIQNYAAELERAVLYIMREAVSESDIRFAHPDAHSDYGDIDDTNSDGQQHIYQVFHRNGGAANYRTPPTAINDGSAWEFTGMNHMPGMGTSRADLIAVLPNLTQNACERVNQLNGQTGSPDDTGACLYLANDSGRFDNGQDFDDSSPNTMDESSFEQDSSVSAVRPSPQACVSCADGNNYFYHVLLAR